MTPSQTAISALTIAVLSIGTVAASDKEAERVGPTYEIAEPDMLDEIMNRMKEKQASGEALRLQKQAAERARVKLLNPRPVEGISKATRNRVIYYDPTVVVHQDIVAPDGRIVVPRGTRANPLDVQDFGDPMFFFDARDPKQVSTALTLIQRYKGGLMPVLTGGSFIDLMKKWKRKVYYDQSGFITKKLGITHVPALVTQEGNRLRIEEMAM